MCGRRMGVGLEAMGRAGRDSAGRAAVGGGLGWLMVLATGAEAGAEVTGAPGPRAAWAACDVDTPCCAPAASASARDAPPPLPTAACPWPAPATAAGADDAPNKQAPRAPRPSSSCPSSPLNLGCTACADVLCPPAPPVAWLVPFPLAPLPLPLLTPWPFAASRPPCARSAASSAKSAAIASFALTSACAFASLALASASAFATSPWRLPAP